MSANWGAIATEFVGAATQHNINHAPGETLHGLAVAINQSVTNGDIITSVVINPATDNIPMERVLREISSSAEAGAAYGYYYGGTMPAGDLVIQVNRTEGTTTIQVVIQGATATEQTEVVASAVQGLGTPTNITDPSVTCVTGGRHCACFCTMWHAVNSPGSVTDGAGMTRVHEHDFTNDSGIVVRQTTPGTGDFTFSFTASQNALALVAFGVAEIEEEPSGGGGGTLPHGVVRQPNRQTTSANSFSDVAGAGISSTNFTAGKKYLLVVTALLDSTDVNKACQVRMVHGATQFPACEHREEPDSTTSKIGYLWWAVWEAADEDVKLQMKSETTGIEVGVSEIEMKWFCLSDGLVENTDWFHNAVTLPIGETTALTQAESTENNASITVLPAVAGQKWLVLSRCDHGVDDNTISHQSRLLRTGEATETLSELIKEGQDAGHIFLFSQVQVRTLGAVSNTFTEKSLLSALGSGGVRGASAVAALNLSKFKQAEIAWTAAKTDLSATDFGTQLETVTITPSTAGDVWSMGYWVHDVGAAGIYGKTRLQVDNVDDPAGQTAAALALEEAHDDRDQMAMVVGTLSSQTAAAHTYDLDASTEAALAGRGGMYRSLFAVTMELAGSEPPPASGEVTYVAGAMFPLGTETTGGEIVIPAVLEGDWLEVQVTSREHTSGEEFVTCVDDDTGGELWVRKAVAASRKGYLFTKRATPNTAGKTVVIAGAIGSCAAVLDAWRGAAEGDPITNLTLEQNLGADPKEHAGFTPDFDKSMIRLGVFNHTDDVPVTDPACTNPGALTPRSERLSTGGSHCAVFSAGSPQAGARLATGTISWVQTNNTTRSMAWAIKPAPDATPPPPPPGSALAKAIAFNIGTGGVATTIEVPVGFPPKAVLFFAIGRTESTDAADQATSQRLLGFAADSGGTIRNRSGVSSSEHNMAAGAFNANRMGRSDSCIVMLDAAGASAGRASLTSFTGDGFVLTIDQQFSADLRIVALCYGGTDLTDCAILDVVTPTAGTLPVAQDVTGLGFTCLEGQAVGFLLGVGHTADNVGSGDAQLGFGSFVKAQDGVLWTGATDHGPEKTLTRRHCSRLRPWGSLAASALGFNKRFQFDGWITDGFRLSHDEISSSAQIIYCLVLKGGRWALADGLTSLFNVDVSLTGLGIGKPVGGLLVSAFSAGETSDDQVNTTDMGCFGVFSSPTDRYVVAQRDQDNTAPSQVATRIEHDQIYASISMLGGLTAAMDFASFDADGVTFHQDIVEEDEDRARQRFFWCVLFGPAAGHVGDPGVGHEYWRARLKKKGALGPAINQLEVVERRGQVAAPGSTLTHPARLHPGISHISATAVLNGGVLGSADGQADVDIFMMSLPAGFVPGLPTDQVRTQVDSLFDSDGVLLPDVLQGDGGTPMPLVKGKCFGRARHGDPITFKDFGRVFLTVPKVTILEGLHNQPTPGKWGTRKEVDEGTTIGDLDPAKPQYPQVGASELDEGGFGVVARLRQHTDLTPEFKELVFPKANFLAVVGDSSSIDVLTGADPDGPGEYDVFVNNACHFRSFDGQPYTIAITYVVETTFNGGGDWQARSSGHVVFTTTISRFADGTINTEAQGGRLEHRIMVPGLSGDGTDRLRVKVVKFEERGKGEYFPLSTGIAPQAVEWVVRNDSYASKTPEADDFIEWTAEGYV